MHPWLSDLSLFDCIPPVIIVDGVVSAESVWLHTACDIFYSCSCTSGVCYYFHANIISISLSYCWFTWIVRLLLPKSRPCNSLSIHYVSLTLPSFHEGLYSRSLLSCHLLLSIHQVSPELVWINVLSITVYNIWIMCFICDDSMFEGVASPASAPTSVSSSSVNTPLRSTGLSWLHTHSDLHL